jgi:hypothetical protein
MKVLLHIGSEKTGTTSIQHWAAANRAPLAARGILYPVAPGERAGARPEPNHVGLALAVSERARRSGLVGMLGLPDAAAAAAFGRRMERRLAEEIGAAGCGTLLLSNEHLSSRLRDEAEVAALRALVERAAGKAVEWHVVLYHRRQDEMIQSIYAMRVLHGAAEPFRLAARADDPRLDPRAILGPMCGCSARPRSRCACSTALGSSAATWWRTSSRCSAWTRATPASRSRHGPTCRSAARRSSCSRS